ncbi:MAG: hypothetical protein ACRDCI_11195 [Plesiomonas shigelloides]
MSSKNVGKNLSKSEAMKKHPYKPSMGDKRGFSYDKKTGVAKWA